jgi:hypothetical protein
MVQDETFSMMVEVGGGHWLSLIQHLVLDKGLDSLFVHAQKDTSTDRDPQHTRSNASQ